MTGSLTAFCVALLFHGGGFVGGVASIPDAEAAVAHTGCQVREVDYRLGNLGAAWHDARAVAHQAAKKHRRVVAYGESAGADLAARLAEKGDVRAAVAFLVPADLEAGVTNDTVKQMIASTYPTPAQLYALAPADHRSRRPVLAQIARQDLLLDTIPVWSWVTRDARVDGEQVEGTHVWPVSPADRAQQLDDAVSFLKRKAL